jgi:predicted nicotinamide N-methyase
MDSFSLESFHRKYETDTVEMTIGGRRFRLLTPKSIDPFIDPNDLLRGFPLWAKIWEASWVLADYLSGIPPDSQRSLLEIGGGLGLVGIVAASFGHRITTTENNPDALQFARANAALNGCSSLQIVPLDWHLPILDNRDKAPHPDGSDVRECNPGDERGYDLIVGSEVIYHQRDFEPLENLFHNQLKSGGEIIIAAAMRQIFADFLKKMQKSFRISATRKVLRSDGEEETRIAFCRMSPGCL